MKLNHYCSLLKLGLPIIIGQIGVIVLGFADTLMIGHHSTEGLAAASFVNNMFNLAIIFCTGFSYGLTPVVGSLFGWPWLPFISTWPISDSRKSCFLS